MLYLIRKLEWACFPGRYEASLPFGLGIMVVSRCENTGLWLCERMLAGSIQFNVKELKTMRAARKHAQTVYDKIIIDGALKPLRVTIA